MDTMRLDLNLLLTLEALLGVRLENGKHPTLSLFFIQTAVY